MCIADDSWASSVPRNKTSASQRSPRCLENRSEIAENDKCNCSMKLSLETSSLDKIHHLSAGNFTSGIATSFSEDFLPSTAPALIDCANEQEIWPADVQSHEEIHCKQQRILRPVPVQPQQPKTIPDHDQPKLNIILPRAATLARQTKSESNPGSEIACKVKNLDENLSDLNIDQGQCLELAQINERYLNTPEGKNNTQQENNSTFTHGGRLSTQHSAIVDKSTAGSCKGKQKYPDLITLNLTCTFI